ncbi:MAG: thioredoxin domain-containing protein [Bryobacteraceae bacterium]|jgi:protein-disulfide isomerase
MRLGAVALILLWPAMAAVSDIDPNKTAGNPSAPVTVQVFSDFECPACKAFHEQSLPLLQRDFVATGKVFLVYREFPLPIHAHSREAANYAVAAAHLGLYQPVADALFRDQVAWSLNGKVWETVASVLTLSQQTKVKAAADSASVLGEILRESNAGRAVPVTSTPTLVVSRGTKIYPVSGTLNYEILKRLIDDVLK